MNRRVALALLAATLALLVAFLLLRTSPPVGAVAPNRVVSSTASKVENQNTKIPANGRSSPAAALNSSATDIVADLRLLDSLLMNFRTNFPREGNPVGTNAEITATLTGTNSLHLALLPRDHPAINQRGELCDRWGTPFFFHQISGTQMEIRSAGPDLKFNTTDDIILTP